MGPEFGAADYDSVSLIFFAPRSHLILLYPRYGINNIRTLVGHKVPIDGVEKSAAVRF